jgi:CBS domain-containing protein
MEPPMQVADVIRRKGGELFAIPASHSLEEASRTLWQRQVGALIVRDRRGDLAGILSERDIVHAIAEHGPGALQRPVSDFMTPDVITCSPDDRIERAMEVMTVHRARHLPVRQGDRLVGIVSIGDLVKHRLDEKTYEADVLRELNIARF